VTKVYAYTALLLVILTFGMETTYFYYSNREGMNRRQVFSTAPGRWARWRRSSWRW